jgi:signal transduction histidine kinase
MGVYLRRLLSPPGFAGDEEKTRIARLLHVILITVMFLVALFTVPAYVLTPEIGRILIELILVAWSLLMLFLLHRGYVQLTGYLFGFTLWATVSYGTYEAGGFAGSTMSAFIGIVVIVALVLGMRAAAFFGFLSVLVTGWMLYADAQGTLPAATYASPLVLWIEFSTVVVGVVALLSLVINNLQQALTRARYNEQELILKMAEAETLAGKAVEANQFKSQFIARISHELRTPLGALMGIAEMLQDNVYGPLSPAQYDIAGRIIKNARALEQVFGELLDQSQIELGQLRLRQELFSPQELVENVHETYHSMAERKGLTLKYEIDPRLPAMVIGDKERIKQVLANLVMNALKYTEQGQITVCARLEDETQWALQVADTGIGISSEAQAYIFEPFRQAGEVVDREFGGVGLGLAIVQQLVEVMNGRIYVESQVEQGSLFTVILPFKQLSDALVVTGKGVRVRQELSSSK